MPVLFSNNASAPLAASITAASTSITVTTGQGALFPAVAAGSYFYATLVDSSNNLEIVKVTARSGDTMTVTRGQEGTTARAYAAADKIELRVTAAGLTNMVQLDGAQTVTGNNTFSGANTFSGTASFTNTITGSISGNAGTVTNGVYTTGDQTIAGVKTFSSTIVGSISGNAGTVTNGVYTTGDQTIAGVKTFTNSVIVNSIYVRVGTSGSGNGGNVRYRNDAGVDQWTVGLLGNAGATDYSWFSQTANATRMTLDNFGNLTAVGDITAFSDERLKQNWRVLDDKFLEDLADVRVGIYDRKDSGETQVGVGAQSLQAILPQAVREDSCGYLSVAYGNAALAAAVMLARRLIAVEKKLGV